MKILNLYAGIGGNRKLWGREHEITAVEHDEEIAALYSQFFPNDTVVVADAHEYLLSHCKEFDFIWSSPPCQSHGQLNYTVKKKRYPDFSLYQEICFLQNMFYGYWLVENVKPYYKPLIAPSHVIGRHLVWTNFYVCEFEPGPVIVDFIGRTANQLKSHFGFEYNNSKLSDPLKARQVVRNCVDPKVGLHVLSSLMRVVDMAKISR